MRVLCGFWEERRALRLALCTGTACALYSHSPKITKQSYKIKGSAHSAHTYTYTYIGDPNTNTMPAVLLVWPSRTDIKSFHPKSLIYTCKKKKKRRDPWF